MHDATFISVGRTRWIAGVLIGVHVALVGWMALRQSPTIDEPGHLAAGIAYWKTGRFDLYAVNPPLAKLAGALPVLALAPNLEFLESESMHREQPRVQGRHRPEFSLGRELCNDNGARIFWLTTVARWGCIPFSILGAVCCYRWGSELYGSAAGLFALALWCFFPEVLAHGSLFTADMPAAAMGVLAGYLFWRWLREPRWGNGAAMGFALGLALLTKFTWLVLLGLWPLLWIIARAWKRGETARPDWVREIGQLASALVLAVALVNAGYLFGGSFIRLGEYDFVSRPLTGRESFISADWKPDNRFRGTWVAALPVPLPEAFVHGVDLQRSDFENYNPAYCGGRLRTGGWWHFYLYAAAVKWPLGFWLLLLLTLAAGRGEERAVDRLALLLPPLLLMGLLSASGTPSYLRYYLPALPFLFVWCGRLAAGPMLSPLRSPLNDDSQPETRFLPMTSECPFPQESLSRSQRETGFLFRRFVPAGLPLSWLIVSSLSVFPHSLSYFNEAAGGPEHGPEHLIDNHIDWGQDLLELERWLARHPEVDDLRLVYHGEVDPRLAGIRFRDVDRESLEARPPVIAPGWYAISVHPLYGGAWRGTDAAGRFESGSRPELHAFLSLTPHAKVGYSIYVYRVDAM